MKPTEFQKNRVKKWIKKWKAKLFLHEWLINTEYVAENPNFPGRLADIEPSASYMEAHLRVYPLFFRRLPKQQEHVLIHELSHCLTEQLYEAIRLLRDGKLVTAEDAEQRLERLTQHIANIAFRDEW